MKKYKIELIKKETFIVDVLAENVGQAVATAREKFDDLNSKNIEHYHQIGNAEIELGNIYDVSTTDDPFNPVNLIQSMINKLNN